MTDYLRKLVDRVADVPTQLRRRLALIRDLDEKAIVLQKEIEGHCKPGSDKASKADLQASKRQKLQDTAAPFDVDSAVRRLMSLADEKVHIANQVYDFIDKHITSLDEDLQALDDDIKQDRDQLGLGDDETACGKLGIDLTKAHKQRGDGQEKPKKGKRKFKDTQEAAGQPALAIPTENEPPYCICQKPSFGQMVGCDNPDCTIEWFHFDCVGLTEEPKGKWLCPVCMEEQKGGAGGSLKKHGKGK